MVEEIDPIRGPSLDAEKLQMQARELSSSVVILKQLPSDDSLTAFAELGEEFDPLAMGKNFKEIDKRTKLQTQEMAEMEGEELDPEVAQRLAEDFHKKNPELNPRALLALRGYVKQNDTPDQLLNKVRSTYADASLADESIDYLIETTSNSAMRAKLENAKMQFNEVFGREVRAGRNIQEAALNFSKQGLGSPTALRDLYRDIVGNPRDANTLFEELTSKFNFQSMKAIIDFVLHSLGSDLKAKGPSIAPAELQRLFSEGRTMQAILGVYRFFFQRMALIQNEFSRTDLTLPALINFQMLAKVFMRMIKERYPSVDRVLTFAALLGISEELAAKIIIYTQFRDALRNVSPKLFQSDKHRQDLLMTLIEALSGLEDDMEEEDEDEDEEEEK